MKKLITAIGNEELNNILKKQDGIIIKSPDIQYQEGIIEALEKYPDIDMLILNDDIIGYLEIDELIRSIIMIKRNVKVILLAEESEQIAEYKNIIKIVNNKKNYVKIILEYLNQEGYIKKKKVTESKNIEVVNSNTLQEGTNVYQISEISNKQEKKYKQKAVLNNNKEIITVIGKSGVRKNRFYIYII